MNVYVGIIVGAMLGMILGGIIGVILMSLVQINKKDALTTIQIFKNSMEHERMVAIREKKDIEYIDGMSRLIALYKNFFKEELQ